MRQCEYCERVSSQSIGENCSGCGAPVRNTGCAIIYDPRVFDGEDVKRFIGRPGTNIPVNLDGREFKSLLAANLDTLRADYPQYFRESQ